MVPHSTAASCRRHRALLTRTGPPSPQPADLPKRVSLDCNIRTIAKDIMQNLFARQSEISLAEVVCTGSLYYWCSRKHAKLKENSTASEWYRCIWLCVLKLTFTLLASNSTIHRWFTHYVRPRRPSRQQGTFPSSNVYCLQRRF